MRVLQFGNDLTDLHMPALGLQPLFFLILFILSMACITRFALSGSLSPNISPKADGIICHDKPYLSLSQPHMLSSPPSAVSFTHNSSTSSWVSQSTKNEMASLNLNCGPAFNAMNSCPSSSNVTDMAMPFGPGVTPMTFELLKMET